MTHVATLISGASSPALDDSLVDHLRSALPGATTATWLANNMAVDISFTPAGKNNNRMLSDRLRAMIGDRPVDVVVQSSRHRRKKLLVADMDSTMIGQECIDELADYAGIKDRIATITERAMRGEIEFEAALRERVTLLKGMPATTIETVLTKRITPIPGARTLVATMRANGAYTCLVSGGFTAFTSRVAAMLGFDEDRANELLIGADGGVDGVREPILGREAKLDALVEISARLGLTLEQAVAVGDGANDIPMIEAAGLGVAYRAKPKVAAAAACRIDHGDLTALLYAQGYRRDAWVGGD
jgi:phosphoserine phosphatase